MVMAVFAALTLSFAVGPILWLGRARIRGWRELAGAVAAVGTATGSALLVGTWALLSVYLRPAILLALGGVLIAAVYRAIRSAPDAKWADISGHRRTWQYGTAFFFAIVLADAGAGRVAPPGTMDLRFPLEPGKYAVLQGGNSLVLNSFHHWFPSDRLALDIVKLNAFGSRAQSLAPANLTGYAIFNAAVQSPCSGTVELVEDDLPDNPPGVMDWEHPPGNHVLLRCGAVRILLAHLRGGSVVVAAGEKIAAGQPVGRVGNSGNTREPHLHIGAETAESPRKAKPVPLSFEGRFLSVNDIVEAAPRE